MKYKGEGVRGRDSTQATNSFLCDGSVDYLLGGGPGNFGLDGGWVETTTDVFDYMEWRRF
jgi:hypothetical protein